jgi:hypothetical protein
MKAEVRALNRDQGSLAATQTQRVWNMPALPNRANARRLESIISFAGGEEERYFAPNHDAQGGGPAGDQSSRDGGVVPKRKVPGKIVPRVGSSRWFPGEFLKRWVWQVVKTAVTSPQEREMQVRILPRELCPRS